MLRGWSQSMPTERITLSISQRCSVQRRVCGAPDRPWLIGPAFSADRLPCVGFGTAGAAVCSLYRHAKVGVRRCFLQDHVKHGVACQTAFALEAADMIATGQRNHRLGGRIDIREKHDRVAVRAGEIPEETGI